MMTRISYCQKCYDKGRPRTGNRYVVWGTTRQALFIYGAKHQGLRGFTPHMFDFRKSTDKTIYYNVACSMCECEAQTIPNPEQKDMFKVGFCWDNRSMPLNEWNALVTMELDPLFEI